MVRLLRSFKWAGQGLRYCFRGEKNFQIQCILSLTAILLGIGLKISSVEWILVCMSIASVLAFEMLNTTIEHLCNIVHPGTHPVIKVIKDVSAGAVLVIAVAAVICGSIVFIPKIISIL